MNFNSFPIKDPYEFEIEQVMQHIVDCYNLMLNDSVKLPNDENDIRSNLVEAYLKNSSKMKHLGIKDYLFDSEVGVFREEDFKQIGRSDIKVSLRSSTFEEPKSHFIIECKRIDGKNHLNREYVREGIMRFTTELYPSFLNLNGMLGFCVQSFDIHTNATQEINNHLTKWCKLQTKKGLSQEVFVDNFAFTYTSSHTTSLGGKDFKLYHTMLDVTSLI